MADEIERKGCDGHCEKCNLNQRTYCAAQMAYYNQQEIAAIKAAMREVSPDELIILMGNKAKSEVETKVSVDNDN